MNLTSVQDIARSLFERSEHLFWASLPVAFLLAAMMIYISGELTGGKLEALVKRVVIAVLLLCAFPEISSTFSNLETTLVSQFGGDEGLKTLFDRIANQADTVKDVGSVSWLKFGQFGLSILSTLSFLILAIVKKFLDVLHLTLWNLLHILGPIALLGCLFPTFHAVPRGIFLGLLELSFWKPFWVILGKLLIAIGFGQAPSAPELWLDAAIMNFAVAGLMVSTPALVHAFFQGGLGGVGSGVMQTMTSGMGAAFMAFPVSKMKLGLSKTAESIARPGNFLKKPSTSAEPSRSFQPKQTRK